MKVSFSLKGKAAKPVGEAPSLKRTAAFAALDDDEPVDAAPTATGGGKGKAAANKQIVHETLHCLDVASGFEEKHAHGHAGRGTWVAIKLVCRGLLKEIWS